LHAEYTFNLEKLLSFENAETIIANCKRILSVESNNANAYYWIGIAQYYINHKQQAFENLTKSKQLGQELASIFIFENF